jgi:predicted DNA-binding protein (MmcQ/YjbR family)
MKFDDFKKYCLSFTLAKEEAPYRGSNHLIAYTVMNKVFAIANPDSFEYINLKCDPVKAAMLRNLYEEVAPSQYVDQQQWNRVNLQGVLDETIIYEWIRDSYELVFEELSRKKQRVIEAKEKEED